MFKFKVLRLIFVGQSGSVRESLMPRRRSRLGSRRRAASEQEPAVRSVHHPDYKHSWNLAAHYESLNRESHQRQELNQGIYSTRASNDVEPSSALMVNEELLILQNFSKICA